MRKLFLLTVIATVVLTACNNDKTKKEVTEEKFTILFGGEKYENLTRFGTILITGEANGDFFIEKAEDVESGKVTLAEKDGQEVKTERFSAKKLDGHNRMQIRINSNPEQSERNFILYVKNGEERGKLTFNQNAYNPGSIGEESPILFDPKFYSIDAKGGVIETTRASDSFFVYDIQEVGGKRYSANQAYPYPTFLEGSFLSAEVIIANDTPEDESASLGGKVLKLVVKPNDTGKDREAYVLVRSVTAQGGDINIFQSAK